MTSTQIQDELDGLRAEIKPTLARIAELERSLRDTRSREWIAEHGVTRADVQPSSGEDVPYFGTVLQMGEWLRTQDNPKPWTEWNGLIYSTAELIAGRMAREALGRYEHAA